MEHDTMCFICRDEKTEDAIECQHCTLIVHRPCLSNETLQRTDGMEQTVPTCGHKHVMVENMTMTLQGTVTQRFEWPNNWAVLVLFLVSEFATFYVLPYVVKERPLFGWALLVLVLAESFFIKDRGIQRHRCLCCICILLIHALIPDFKRWSQFLLYTILLRSLYPRPGGGMPLSLWHRIDLFYLCLYLAWDWLPWTADQMIPCVIWYFRLIGMVSFTALLVYECVKDEDNRSYVFTTTTTTTP